MQCSEYAAAYLDFFIFWVRSGINSLASRTSTLLHNGLRGILARNRVIIMRT
jgi:hypothetical protein